MFFPPPVAPPAAWQKRYQLLRVFLYLVVLIITVIFAVRVFFPIIEQRFDFRSSGSSKNTILSPRSPQNALRTNGKIEQKGVLIADTALVGDFSRVTVTATLEKDSASPETLPFSLRRSYQSFLYPTGEVISNFPEKTAEVLYIINDTYYALRNGTLFPFVSEQAYLSRYPKSQALATDSTLLDRYPISEEWLGFRVGSLLGNATGVFVVTSDAEVRPVGSAEIFLALGYNFSDVTAASEEELGIYRRGRIFLLGAAHPDGTVLFDRDTGDYFLIEQGTKRPLLPGVYRDFLLQDTHPILVSSQASRNAVTCDLAPNFFGTALSCATPITNLTTGFGNDFEIQIISPDKDIDINTLSVSFETAKNTENVRTLLSQIKQRLLARFGGS